MLKLYDGCWVLREGEDQPQQAFQEERVSCIYRIGGDLYAEHGKALPALPWPRQILRILSPEEAYATVPPEQLFPTANRRA